MAKITFTQHDGSRTEVDAELGQSVMEAAKSNGVPGIVADCGGACACATCHVHVHPSWFERTGSPDEMEIGMLDCAEDVASTSRLSCQIMVTVELDGLVVNIPAEQHFG